MEPFTSPADWSFEYAAPRLRNGDCTACEPLFVNATSDPRSNRIINWFDAGLFDSDPAALAEALTCACWLGRVGVAEYLLDHGVDPTAGVGTGMDALHWAANRGQLAAVRLLIARGVPIETINAHGTTVLGTAIWSAINEPCRDHLAIIEALLEAGANVGAVRYPSGHAGVDAMLRAHTATLNGGIP